MSDRYSNDVLAAARRLFSAEKNEMRHADALNVAVLEQVYDIGLAVLLLSEPTSRDFPLRRQLDLADGTGISLLVTESAIEPSRVSVAVRNGAKQGWQTLGDVVSCERAFFCDIGCSDVGSLVQTLHNKLWKVPESDRLVGKTKALRLQIG